MASLIPGYEYDIFISYRQKDNKGDRWVSEFVEALKDELESTFKEEISVYFDINPHDGLLETHYVDESLKDKLRCLVFVPIISRTYCDPNSYAWENEFKIFIEQAKKDQFGLKIRLPGGNVASRILPVIIHDLDNPDIKLCESMLEVTLRGVEFIYKSTGVNRPLRSKEEKPYENLNKTVYRDQINKVANAVKDIIQGLKTVKELPETDFGLPKEISVKKSEYVEKPGIKNPHKFYRKRFIYLGGLIVLAIVAAIYFFPGYYMNNIPDPSICIILPDPSRSVEGAFYQDGAVQIKGFRKALEESDRVPNCLPVDTLFMGQNFNTDTIMCLIKEKYKKRGATFFIMTMSSKIEGIKDHFISWHDSCLLKGQREPILIATVASAPGLADIESGILRWYIRSKEESNILAEYMAWNERINNVGIFYITRTDGLADDTYGHAGSLSFQSRFIKLSQNGNVFGSYPTTVKTARKNVETYLNVIRTDEKLNSKKFGAYIVGYGAMVKTVLEELIAQGFSGPIACSSTLTEPDWQPDDRRLDKRIFTVLPKLKDPGSGQLPKDDRNVVYYFSKETLKRVLEITSEDPNSGNFHNHWIKMPPASDKIDQEILADGDCFIQLDVINSEQWR